jgi:succinoglycan biosynthesis transport protein ExoP
MSFNQFLVILRARWLIAAGIFVAVVVLIAFASIIWPRQYTATASVVIDSKTDPVAQANGGAGGELPATYVNTQADIISSVRVAQRVVRTLKLDQQPEARKLWAKGPDDDISVTVAKLILDKKLLVAPAHDSPTHASNVIDISVTWSDPVTAAALANGFAQAAIETNIELKVEPAKQYASWFDQRSRALRADLEDKQKKLSDFQSKNGIIATDEKLDVENARLNELSTELVTIQGLRQDSQSRQHQVGSDISTLPEVLQSPVIQSLKAALVQAEGKKPDVAARLGKNHPDYQAVESEISDLRTRIAQESANIAASLGNATQSNLRRENDVRQALEAQKKKVLELKYQHDQSAMFESDVTAAQRDLDQVSQRLAQSNLESLTQQTNVVQLTTATAPSGASSPKVVINLIVAIFLGGMLGIATALAAEMRNRRVREDEDIVDLLGVPLLGKLDVVRVRVNDVRVLQPAPGRLEPSVI